jgi:DUF4097 and DUF4098 domain-containing protein YvlB
MSWLISLVLAGVVFTSDTTVPVQRTNNFANSETTQIISLGETERFEQTYPLNSNGRVRVDNVNGSVTIDTWDRNEVKLEAVKTADDKERLSEVEIKIDARKDYLSVETDYLDQWKRNGDNRGWKNYGKLTVDYTLTVPKNAVLDDIQTVNGSVTISNSNNITKASTVNGEVIATNLRGTAELETVNGTIEANFDQLQSSSRINLNTVNGRVNLTIPSDANATVKADTLNGSITNDFGLPVRKGEYVGRDMYGKIGSGEVQIKLNSVNGGLNIKRKNDGKNVNPATNLLPPKSQNDEDDFDNDNDNDNDNSINVDKMNKDIKKSVKESQKVTAVQRREMQKAQKEIEKIKPEIAKINNEEIQAKIQAKVQEDMKRQQEALGKLATVNFFPGTPVIEKKSETFAVKGTPKVTVDARNCSVTVRGWDKQEVQYSITRVSKARNQKPLAYTVDHSDSDVNIKVAGGGTTVTRNGEFNFIFNDLERVRVEVFVPKKSNLRILTNREIRLENVSGEIDLTGGDESINVRDVDGKLKVASVDGKIRVIGFKGEIDSKTADGDMSLEGDFQKITATSGDGNIIVTLPDDVSATIKANTESVSLDGISPKRIKTVDISEGAAIWRIGNGNANFSFTVAEGQVFIRSMNDLKASL